MNATFRYTLILLSQLTVCLHLPAQLDMSFFNSVDLDGRGSGNDAFKLTEAGSVGVDDVGDVFIYENVGFDGSTYYDVTLEITSLNGTLNGIRANSISDSLVVRLGPPGSGTQDELQNPYVTFSLSIYEGDANYGNVNNAGQLGVAATLPNLTFQIFDIDSQDAADFTDIFGYNTSTSSPDSTSMSASTELETGGWLAMAPSGFTTYRAEAPVPDDWTDVPNISTNPLAANAADYGVNFNYSSGFSTGEFVWGITGTEPGTTRSMFLNGSNPPYIVIPEPASAMLALSCLMAAAFGIRLSGRKRFIDG